jgi:pyrroloquinoline-quinone synthase
MSTKPRLLDHPFYRAWEMGEVSQEALATYHRSYADFIQRIPSYWQTVVNSFQPESTLGTTIVQEERDHIILWELWGKTLKTPDDFPRLQNIIDAFDSMTPSELLGALHAFEVQQPEVARSKKDGLLRHYGFHERDLAYFDAHQMEERHIEYGRWLSELYANKDEYQDGYSRGAELVYKSLDHFMSEGEGGPQQNHHG